MFKRVTVISIVTIATLLVVAGLNSAREQATASTEKESLDTRLVEELSTRVATLEARLKDENGGHQDETSEAGQDADYSEHFAKMAAALEKMAEKSDKLDDISSSLEKIVERLTNIEEELAWSRIDAENEQ